MEREWVNEFTMQMTIQRATDDDIRMALADVRSHCADSGESARDVFGDPKEYATLLAAELPRLPPEPRISPRRIATLLPLTLGAAVFQIPLWAPRGDDAAISVGHVLLAAVAVPAWVILTTPLARRRLRDPLRPGRPAFDEQGWRGLWATLGLALVGAALWLGFDHSLFTVPKWILTGLGLALLATGFVLLRVLMPRASDTREPAGPGRGLPPP